MDSFDFDDRASRRFAPLPGRPIRLATDLERHSTLLMDFGGRESPRVGFSFGLPDAAPVEEQGLERIPDVLEPLVTSTRAAHRLGLAGPPGSDSDIVERVVIGPTGDEAPDEGEGGGDV